MSNIDLDWMNGQKISYAKWPRGLSQLLSDFGTSPSEKIIVTFLLERYPNLDLTYSQIGHAVGIDSRTVAVSVKNLEAIGLITTMRKVKSGYHIKIFSVTPLRNLIKKMQDRDNLEKEEQKKRAREFASANVAAPPLPAKRPPLEKGISEVVTGHLKEMTIKELSGRLENRPKVLQDVLEALPLCRIQGIDPDKVYDICRDLFLACAQGGEFSSPIVPDLTEQVISYIESLMKDKGLSREESNQDLSEAYKNFLDANESGLTYLEFRLSIARGKNIRYLGDEAISKHSGYMSGQKQKQALS